MRTFLWETESEICVYTVGDLDSGSILLSVLKALKTHQAMYKYNTTKLIALTAPLIHTHMYILCPALYLLNQHLEPNDIYHGSLWIGSTVNCILCVFQKNADATDVNLISTWDVTGSEINGDDLLKRNIKGTCLRRNTIRDASNGTIFWYEFELQSIVWLCSRR